MSLILSRRPQINHLRHKLDNICCTTVGPQLANYSPIKISVFLSTTCSNKQFKTFNFYRIERKLHMSTQLKNRLNHGDHHSHEHTHDVKTTSTDELVSHQHQHDHGKEQGDHPTESCSSEDHNHSHSGISMLTHTHSHTPHNELLSSSFSNPAVRITWIGLVVNISLAISKGLGGYYFRSQSLLADAIHSLSDMVADFLTLATVNVASKVGSPDRFPLGYGKLESLGSLLVSGVLLFAGVSIGWSSLLAVFEYTMPAYLYEWASKIQIGHSHSHSFGLEDTDINTHHHDHSHSTSVETPTKEIPNINAAWLAGASIVVKELLFRSTMKVATETNSKVLVANAWHHRVDSLTALVAVITVTGGVFFQIAWLDSIGGLIVSALIIRAGWGSFKNSILELVDRGEPSKSEESSKVKDITNNVLDDKPFKLLNISVLLSGANTNVFLTIVASKDSKASLQELNVLENEIVDTLRSEDKFIKNVFVQFKTLENTKYELLNEESINKTIS